MGKKKRTPKNQSAQKGTGFAGRDLITGNWEIDTLGTPTTKPGGIFYRTGMKETDKGLRFGEQGLYRDSDSSMTYTPGDTYLGYSVSSASTTGKTGTFSQNSIGSTEFSFFADALGGAKAGNIIFTTSPW